MPGSRVGLNVMVRCSGDEPGGSGAQDQVL